MSDSEERTTIRPISLSAEGQELLQDVARYYHDTLKVSSEGMDYLKARCIYHPEAIAKFRLGYANRTLGLTLPDKAIKAGALVRGRLMELGLYRDSGHEHFSGSLVIPVMDPTGVVVQVYGRKLLNHLRKGTPMHLYLPGPLRGVWNEDALRKSKEVILAKSLIDALSFWCAGFRNVTAAYGNDGFTSEHLEAFQRHGTERVLIGFDSGEAGDRAAEGVAAKLAGLGIDCLRLRFPEGMDANAVARRGKPAARALGQIIRAAEPMVNHPTSPQTNQIPTEPASPTPEPVAAEAPEKVPTGAAASDPAPSHEIQGHDLLLVMEERQYRVRGWATTRLTE